MHWKQVIDLGVRPAAAWDFKKDGLKICFAEYMVRSSPANLPRNAFVMHLDNTVVV